MKYIWEKIKKDIASTYYTQIKDENCSEAQYAIIKKMYQDKICRQKSKQELANMVYDTIINWDIRNVNGLRNLFKEEFPKNIQTGSFNIDRDEKGNWILIKE